LLDKSGKTGTIQKTGTGNEFIVFATVLDIINYIIKQNKSVKEITFSADKDEMSRVSLYKKMVKKLLPSSYDVKIRDYNPRDIGEIEFIIIKK